VKVASLFAGVGGIEKGLSSSGNFEPSYFCEWWESAQAVLRANFPGVPVEGDIREVRRIPRADMVTGGFPCTDLSQAGRTAGIEGDQSGLVLRALELIENHKATWLMLENVRNMLVLHRGRAMAAITSELDRMSFRWAYRLVDARFTGVPQRRQRVILLASRKEDPRPVLFGANSKARDEKTLRSDAFGFYWTEGLRGLGWCQDGVPTLKGGSTIGIPSPPAIWVPEAELGGRIVTPGIRSAELLQGFPRDWTAAAAGLKKGEGQRWKMVGNAVPVGIGEWVGRNILETPKWNESTKGRVREGMAWPTAAWGDKSGAYEVEVSLWPEHHPYRHLLDLVRKDRKPLSYRGTAGFLRRLESGSLHVPAQFPIDLKEHLEFMDEGARGLTA